MRLAISDDSFYEDDGKLGLALKDEELEGLELEVLELVRLGLEELKLEDAGIIFEPSPFFLFFFFSGSSLGA